MDVETKDITYTKLSNATTKNKDLLPKKGILGKLNETICINRITKKPILKHSPGVVCVINT